MSYYAIQGEEFLSHHGILGQKWGKRNGPPYPLDPEDHSKAEKDAVKKTSNSISKNIEDKFKKAVFIGSKVIKKALGVCGSYSLSKFYSKYNSIEMGTVSKDFNWVPSDYRKRTDEGYSNQGYLDRQFAYFKEEYFDKKIFDSMNELPRADKDYINELFKNKNTDILVDNINLNKQHKIDVNRDQNCFNTVSAMILRLRGYDVRSRMSKSTKGFNMDLATRIFEGSKMETIDSNNPSYMVSKLLEKGNNRYGYLDVQWADSLNHHGLLYATINNEVLFIDGQYEKLRPQNELMSQIIIDNSHFVDVTDFEPNDYILATITRNVLE